MSGSTQGKFTFAPGVVDALLSTYDEEARARAEYHIWLGEMDVAQAAHAHKLLLSRGIDHASPAGYVCFRTPEERLEAMKLLSSIDPGNFGWKWRVPLRGAMPQDLWFEQMFKQPYKPEYLAHEQNKEAK